MKKFFIFILMFFLQLSFANAEMLSGEITFDWISKSQMERDENIELVKRKSFSGYTVQKYGKKFFRETYKDKLKDENYLMNYAEIREGKTDDAYRAYCGFYWKKFLMAYGIQYKEKPDENFYYDARGNLRWVDKYSREYPNFPYKSYQYDTNGNLRAVYYFNSHYDQYIFDAKGNFRGRWYKDKMYDNKAKVIMTRTNWE